MVAAGTAAVVAGGVGVPNKPPPYRYFVSLRRSKENWRVKPAVELATALGVPKSPALGAAELRKGTD